MNILVMPIETHPTTSLLGSRTSRTASGFWSAPVLWRFGDDERESKNGRRLPQSTTLARGYTRFDSLAPQ